MQTKQLSLIREKITELRTALFFCDSPGALPYAGYLVEIQEMDEQGFIWLNVKKQSGQGVLPGELFKVNLEFYRKGVPYTIDIKGMACITDATDERLLLRIEIGKLKYKEFASIVQPLEVIGKVFKDMLYIPGPMDAFATEE